jgi:putative membrane protein
MFVRLGTAIAVICLSSSVAMAQGAKLTDPQIAHIAYTAGEIDIKAAKQAIDKASNKDVKQFAQDMLRDHAAVNKQALDLVKKLKVTPEDNDTSKALSKQAGEKLAELASSKARHSTRPISPTRSPTTRPWIMRSRPSSSPLPAMKS